ncbi:MAG TPA: 5'-3' exonuclease H3TH domain-containing protein [Methylomirabilota bacterium]|nr:5'-3' exonuclease H3TH domain-containing protein [Methylomirabilota bacterium]
MAIQPGLQLEFGAGGAATRNVRPLLGGQRGGAPALAEFDAEVPPMNELKETLLIVDGHAYAYRAFYAIRQLNSPATGLGTNAIYGFIRMLGKVRSWLKPTHVVVIWDGGLAKERMEALPDYKAQRPPMPSDLERQIIEIEQWLQASRIPSVTLEGIEADDCIATLARSSAESGARVIIASSDKDFMQLVEDHKIGLLNPNDKTETLWFEEQVRAKMQVSPKQIVDYLALLGDSVDNIPGVPGVGGKTAAGLLAQFGSIDGIYSRLSEVKPDKIRLALVTAEQAVRRNIEIVKLRFDISCDLRLENYKVREGEYEKLREFYERCGFRTLLEELTKSAGPQRELM